MDETEKDKTVCVSQKTGDIDKKRGIVMRRIIYDGDSFYELDEECLKKKEAAERRKEMKWQERDQRTDQTLQKENGRQTTDHTWRQGKRRK